MRKLALILLCAAVLPALLSCLGTNESTAAETTGAVSITAKTMANTEGGRETKPAAPSPRELL